MKLRKVTIKRFRGIKELTLDLDDTTVLIGENNTGKTAVLDAIRICLTRVRSARGFAFDTYDLHLENATAEPTSADPIVLTLVFREDKENDWSKDDLRALKSIVVDHQDRYQVALRVEARHDPTAGEYVQEVKFLDGDENPLVTPAAAIGAFQDRVRCHYLAALRDAGTHFGAKGQFWRPFLKDAQLPPDKKKEIEELLERVNKEVVSSHGSFKKAMERLKDVQDVLPLASGDVVSVEAVPGRIFDMLTRARVNLGGSTGARIPVGRHGEGTQSLSVLMLFRAFVEAWPHGHPFLALEEPEAHLHPSAIRALWSIVEALPGQKLITTHSGDLLSEVPAMALRRLHRGPTGIEARRLNPGTLDPTQTQKFDFHVRHSRGELLFARCWLLVEGETEMTLLPELARVLGLSFERSGVRCVEYRQADIEVFIKVANDLGIAWCAMPDDDGQGRKDQKKVRENLNSKNEADVLFIPPHEDIERVLCSTGFEHVYEARISAQKIANSPITAAKGTPSYWAQLLKVMTRGYKPAAAQQIADEIQNGAAVPPFLEVVVRGALKLAEAN